MTESAASAAIDFTSNWQQIVQGTLAPGNPFSVNYDSARLPEIRDTYNGMPTWSILGYIQFHEGDDFFYQPLETPGEGQILTSTYSIPEDAEEVIMWFKNTGRSGRVAYDSEYGENYHFRFTSMDVRLLSASVSTDPQTPYSGFNVSVSASPGVTSVTVRFTTDPPYAGSQPGQYTDVPLAVSGQEGDRIVWSVGGVAVPYRATVTFSVLYVANGRSYIDDNGGAGYEAGQSSG